MIVCDACRKSMAELKKEKTRIQHVGLYWTERDLTTSNPTDRQTGKYEWDLCQDCLDALDLEVKQAILKVIHKHPEKGTNQ